MLAIEMNDWIDLSPVIVDLCLLEQAPRAFGEGAFGTASAFGAPLRVPQCTAGMVVAEAVGAAAILEHGRMPYQLQPEGLRDGLSSPRRRSRRHRSRRSRRRAPMPALSAPPWRRR